MIFWILLILLCIAFVERSFHALKENGDATNVVVVFIMFAIFMVLIAFGMHRANKTKHPEQIETIKPQVIWNKD